MEAPILLDTRHLTAWERNDAVFAQFDRLPPGGSLSVLHYQDLQTLFCRLMAERAGEFTWESQECGPIFWRASITRRSPCTPTVGEVIRQRPQARVMLEEVEVDICETLDEPFHEVCRKFGLPAGVLQAQAKATSAGEKTPARAGEWPISFLLDYIIQNHHGHIYKVVPQIKVLLSRLTELEGSQYTDLFIVKKYFELLTEELFIHLHKEEYLFFPIIRSLVRAGERGTPPNPSLLFRRIGDPATVLEEEDQAITGLLENIRRVTGNYTLPKKANAVEWLLYTLLREFDEDLHQHIYLESKVLFSKALALEQELTSRHCSSFI
jgi:regulator of cell morphogenesis and NO signaling